MIHDHWDEVWQETNLSAEEDKRIIEDELCSLRWKKIEKEIISKYGSFKGLNIIEIGSGRGEISLIMALKGAMATLLDKSPFGLKKASDLFRHFNLSPQLIKCDIFSIPASLYGNFDIVLSFGLVEHFSYPQRQDAIDIHHRLLKRDGVCIISVPNCFCFAYWPFRILAKASGHWKMGFEKPFTPHELLRCAKAADFKDNKIFGTSFIRDTVYFLFFKPLFRIIGKIRPFSLGQFEIPAILDDAFGAYITLVGSKV